MLISKIQIEQSKINQMNKILKQLDFYEDCGKNDVIETFTAKFEGTNIEADIKICNGDGPYLDAVLFDNGNEVCVLDASDKIQEEYDFEYKGQNYKIIIEII